MHTVYRQKTDVFCLWQITRQYKKSRERGDENLCISLDWFSMSPSDKMCGKRTVTPTTIKNRPFLARLSTDGWDTLVCERNIVLQTPHRFEASSRRRSSLADFTKASLEFDELAKVLSTAPRAVVWEGDRGQGGRVATGVHYLM